MMDEKIIEAMKATIVEAFNKSGPSFSVRMTSGITAPQVNHIECTFDLEAVTRAAWAAAKVALAKEGLAVVPREPTNEMRAAGGQSEPFIMPSPNDPTRLWQPGEIIAATAWRAMIAAAPQAPRCRRSESGS